MLNKVTGWLVASSLVGAYSCVKDGLTHDEAIAVANRHVESVMPQIRLDWMQIHAEDSGQVWQVIYCPPAGSTGSPFILAVAKRSREVSEVRANPFATARRYCPGLLELRNSGDTGIPVTREFREYR